MEYVEDNKTPPFPPGFWERIYEYNKERYKQEAIDPLIPTTFPEGRVTWETHTVPRYG